MFGGEKRRDGKGPGTRKARNLFEILLHTHTRTQAGCDGVGGREDGRVRRLCLFVCLLEDRLQDKIIIIAETETRVPHS